LRGAHTDDHRVGDRGDQSGDERSEAIIAAVNTARALPRKRGLCTVRARGPRGVVVRGVGDDRFMTEAGNAGVGLDVERLGEADIGALEREARNLASSIAAVTCRWLLIVAELDRREAWRACGCRGMAHWLAWKCGVAPNTARQHLEVARRLGELPMIRARFDAGTLSFSKVRAICRYATPLNEAAMVDVADSATAAMLERLLAALGRALTVDSERDLGALAHLRRGLRMRSRGDDGTIRVTIDATPECAKALRARIRELGAEVPDECVAAAADPTAARAHDAFERLITGPDPAAVTINLHVDLADLDAVKTATTQPAAVGASAEAPITACCSRVGATRSTAMPMPWSGDRFGLGRASAEALLDPATISPPMARLLRRIGDDARVRVVIDDRGATIDLGRTSRDPSRPLRRYILRRDRNRCRFAGCDHSAEHIHHIRAWIDGGPTDRANLVAVCRYHHRLVHDGGWWISGDPERHNGLRFHHPRCGSIGDERIDPQPVSTIDARGYVDDPTGSGLDTRHYHGPMDLHWAVANLIQLIPKSTDALVAA
jgi:Domain of unknown function (DUF222)/HNH endonuclease